MTKYLLCLALLLQPSVDSGLTRNLKFTGNSLLLWVVSIRGTGSAALSTEAHSGNRGLTTSGPTTKGVIVYRDIQDLIPGQALLVSVRVKSAQESAHPVSLLLQDSKENNWVSIDHLPNTSWHQMAQVYTVNSTRALRIELFEPPDATETVYWDDVNIRAISSNELVGDAGRGAGAYARRCANCHELDSNQRGPQLRRIYGAKSASVPKFFYSDALKKANLTWDEAALDKWLANPDEFLPNTDMHHGANDRFERLDIIAYLKQLPGDHVR